MSLKFYFGGSGAGKSTELYREIIERSKAEQERNFLVIVPDQFTMQTQKELVTLHDRGGIMNIDVLSFGRLSHRIFEEVGVDNRQVLDDTGKSLVLRKVAADLKENLPVLGSNLTRQGYVHEMKSAISEFMQYGIGVGDMDKLISFSEKRGGLYYKLKDLAVLYEGFLDYIQGRFITTEETLGVLQNALQRSDIVKDSVVIFDGFTGFTPIQNRVLQTLMLLAAEVIVTVTLDTREDPYVPGGEQELFYLSKKTVRDLDRLAKKAGVPREEDVFLNFIGDGHRFAQNPALFHLEQSIFRYRVSPYENPQESIRIFEATTPGEEARQTGILIEKLVRERGYCYRDFAVIAGDLEAYASHVEAEFGLLGIPCYVDRTRGIVLNPFIEYIRSALLILVKDFSYQSIFQYLRSGLADFLPEEVDRLENYIIRTGIRGRKRWNRMFVGRMEQAEEEVKALEEINILRERLLEQLAPLLALGKEEPVQNYVRSLYDFLITSKSAEKLTKYEAMFTQQNEPAKAKEYAQIYRLVMELLDQMIALLPEERMSLREFADILDAGFGEIEVGTIPQNVDRVLVGDMQRTRLKETKVLFFLGVNDGNIPMNNAKGGIISDIDREFLRQSELELAPSPRQQMYIQRLYLYLNMTKPSDLLYLSFAKVSGEGKSLRPSYLIDTICKLFPDVAIFCPERESVEEQIITPGAGLSYMAGALRDYASGFHKDEQVLFTFYDAYQQDEQYKRVLEKLTEAAFYRYENSGLSKEVAKALYGQVLHNSVSRLETYAACAHAHFLQYGLTLKERKEFGFETVDMGNIFHGVLELFSKKLEESEYTWFNFSEDFGESTVSEALDFLAAQYGDTVLYSSARNEYAIRRMRRILNRTVFTMQYQLQQGSFVPKSYEISFAYASDLDSVNIELSNEEKMQLKGRIDRIDIQETADQIYVKVVDYKSGRHKFDLVALYYGLQLQLVLYMNAAVELQKREHPEKEVIPAALLYYHVSDPALESPQELSQEELKEKLADMLRMEGVVNSADQVIRALDETMESKSHVIPVEKKKDGDLSSRSSVLGSTELQEVSNYVNKKVKSLGREILDGRIELNPYEDGSDKACTYCAYKGVCGFDRAVGGYSYRRLQNMKQEEVMEAIQKANLMDREEIRHGS